MSKIEDLDIRPTDAVSQLENLQAAVARHQATILERRFTNEEAEALCRAILKSPYREDADALATARAKIRLFA